MADRIQEQAAARRQPRLLVVDDDERIAHLSRDVLAGAGYAVDAATSLPEARKLLQNSFYDLLILDERMPLGSGSAFFAECREQLPDIGAIFITGYPDVALARKVFRNGALDFLVKGISQDELLVAVEEALRRSHLKRQNRYLQHQLASGLDTMGIIGESGAIQRVKSLATKAASADVPILLEGESGTGKELFARAIHHQSGRKGPLICVNVGAIPQTLLESELFGHAKGAFTGADRHRQGTFEAADGGTIFLDEIGEMSLDAQVRLLRVLDQKEVTRVGETRVIPVDVRVIAATNKRLYEQVAKAAFRDDLYYRLAVIHISIPPLRERNGDIVVLAEHFLEKVMKELHREGCSLSTGAIAALQSHSWPGNVRELKNAIERSMILSDAPEIGSEYLQLDVHSGDPICDLLSSSWQDAQNAFGKRYFETVIALAGGNKSKAADIAGVNRSTLYECLTKFGCKIPSNHSNT